MGGEKKPQLFVKAIKPADYDEPSIHCGEIQPNGFIIEKDAHFLGVHIASEIRERSEWYGPDESEFEFRVSVKMMTDAEVAALKEV